VYKTLVVRRVTAGTVYKLLAVGGDCLFVPLGLFLGVLSSFGAHLVHVNGTAVTGPPALVAGPLIGLGMAAFLAIGGGTVCVIGLWFFSRFRPLTLVVKELANEQSIAA
jgi:hypothetical protein